MSNLQVKNVPQSVHEELRRRAAEDGLSLRDYVLRLILRDLALPSARDWIGELDQLQPVLCDESPADVIAAVRRERDHESAPQKADGSQ